MLVHFLLVEAFSHPQWVHSAGNAAPIHTMLYTGKSEWVEEATSPLHLTLSAFEAAAVAATPAPHWP